VVTQPRILWPQSAVRLWYAQLSQRLIISRWLWAHSSPLPTSYSHCSCLSWFSERRPFYLEFPPPSSEPYWPLHCSFVSWLECLTIHQLNLLRAVLFMYKVYNNLLPQYFIDMFVPNCTVHSHNTRQREKFHVPYHRLFSTSNSIRFYGVIVWNSICKDIRNIKSLKLFRTKYKYCNIQW